MQTPVWSLEYFRARLAHVEALPQLVILGLVTGFCTALLVSLFAYLVDGPLTYFLGGPHGFEELSTPMRFALPIGGSLLLIVILRTSPAPARKMGMVHVLERLSYHQGHLPFRNMLNQLLCASIALLSGHSVGREGPAVHLGAACSSLIGQKLKLPNNTLRLLVGCGTAAAISAAFNTPLAGIIFAMEVILLEYTLVGFLPIIVAAVAADVATQTLFGTHLNLNFPSFDISSFSELPYISLIGVIIGLLAALFCKLVKLSSKSVQYPLTYRLLTAGLLTGTIAIWVPEVMGLGFDTLTQALNGGYLMIPALTILTAKLLLTPVIIGLGVPAGLIGPTLLIGALAGAALGIIGAALANQPVAHTGFYAMLGMGAMMAAVINAPLAALTALLEFTGNPNIILPAMITIVISSLTVRYLFKLPSVFISTLKSQGLDYQHHPVSQALSRAAVGSLMRIDFSHCQRHLDHNAAMDLCHSVSELLVQDHHSWAIIRSADLLTWLEQQPPNQQVDLFSAQQLQLGVSEISIQASLDEALETMKTHNVEHLYIENRHQQICGLLSRCQLEQYYLEGAAQ